MLAVTDLHADSGKSHILHGVSLPRALVEIARRGMSIPLVD